MVWAISDCPGTEQNINIKGAIYNFQSAAVENLTEKYVSFLVNDHLR